MKSQSLVNVQCALDVPLIDGAFLERPSTGGTGNQVRAGSQKHSHWVLSAYLTKGYAFPKTGK